MRLEDVATAVFCSLSYFSFINQCFVIFGSFAKQGYNLNIGRAENFATLTKTKHDHNFIEGNVGNDNGRFGWSFLRRNGHSLSFRDVRLGLVGHLGFVHEYCLDRNCDAKPPFV